MERTEPTFVPEWLKTSSSASHSDDQSVPKVVRNKSLVNGGDNDLGRSNSSSFFRRANGSNGGAHLRAYSSFGRNRDRDWDRDRNENRHRDYSDPFRFEKDGLRRSYSNLSAKRGESWPRKVVGERNGHNNNNGKISFERDFPSLGAEEKHMECEIGRVTSPGLTSAIQSLPVGNSGGDVWTSALAEVPVMVGSNGPTSVSVSTNVATGRNMAETLAQGPPRAQAAPQVSVGTQRLEELAVKQSRQLIPMTPSMPKALALNSSDKTKLKGGQLQHQSSHILNHSLSPRPVSVKPDISKASSTGGKLHILKPSRERNGITPTPKESSSPTSGSKVPNSPLAVPSVVAPPPLRNSEKRPSPQAKSRNDFFNLMRKKSMANHSSSSPLAPDTGSSDSANDKPAESRTEDEPVVVQPSGESKLDSSCNGDSCVVTETPASNGKINSNSDVMLYSEEEEAAFLRSLGWEETAEEEGLTEEEINSFYRDVSKYVNVKPASNFFKGTQPKCMMPFMLQMGKNVDISSDAKVDV